jgi:hypothetical protein
LDRHQRDRSNTFGVDGDKIIYTAAGTSLVLIAKLEGEPMSRRAYNRRFAEAQRQTILSVEKHPLRFLLDKNGNWEARSHLSEDHGIQIGHLTSLHSGAPERLALQDAFFNQQANWRGEQLGVIFETTAVLIGGVPVESQTALAYERAGDLPEGTVAAAPPCLGWSPVYGYEPEPAPIANSMTSHPEFSKLEELESVLSGDAVPHIHIHLDVPQIDLSIPLGVGGTDDIPYYPLPPSPMTLALGIATDGLVSDPGLLPEGAQQTPPHLDVEVGNLRPVDEFDVRVVAGGHEFIGTLGEVETVAGALFFGPAYCLSAGTLYGAKAMFDSLLANHESRDSEGVNPHDPDLTAPSGPPGDPVVDDQGEGAPPAPPSDYNLPDSFTSNQMDTPSANDYAGSTLDPTDGGLPIGGLNDFAAIQNLVVGGLGGTASHDSDPSCGMSLGSVSNAQGDVNTAIFDRPHLEQEHEQFTQPGHDGASDNSAVVHQTLSLDIATDGISLAHHEPPPLVLPLDSSGVGPAHDAPSDIVNHLIGDL